MTTGPGGVATVTLPSYFQALNRDYRYQLTTIGQQAQAWVSEEISQNRFTIKTDKPNVKVSWQVTGIRQDPWANANRPAVEPAKEAREVGYYIHPERYGEPETKNVMATRHPQLFRSQTGRAREQQLFDERVRRAGPWAP